MFLVTITSSCHGAHGNGVNVLDPRALALTRKNTMESYLEQYEAKEGGVTLHTWTDIQGARKENLYITGMPDTPIPWWFWEVLRQKHLVDLVDFPYTPSCFYA